MGLLSVRPDDLQATAGLTGGAAAALHTGARLIPAAGGQAVAGATPAGALATALEGYARVETAVAAALADAAEVLTSSLATGAAAYARAETSVSALFGGPGP